MTTLIHRYDLPQFEDIIFQGFNFTVPEETIQVIMNLTKQVGSPSYDKTPVFKKREHVSKNEEPSVNKKRRNKNMEIVNDADWEDLRSFQATKIETKTGIQKELDSIRALINKITDKNYTDLRDRIIGIIDAILETDENADLSVIGTNLFLIASSNRYYSKNYAELYTDLSKKYEFLKTYYEENLQQFVESFNTIEFVSPEENYDKFCEINKINEKRKSLATFYMNLMNNGVVSKEKMVEITRNLLASIVELISIENTKIRVEEMTENFAILFKPELFDGSVPCSPINGQSVCDTIKFLANCKTNQFKSLNNKIVFKFMDLIEM